MIITNFPIITDQNQYTDISFRIFWYFSPYDQTIEKINLICNKKYNLDRMPTHFDSKVELNRTIWDPKIITVVYQSPNQLMDLIENSDFILLADMNLIHRKRPHRKIHQLLNRNKAKIINFDKYDVAGTKILPELRPNPYTSIDCSHRFKQLKNDIGPVKNCYIYGTGPSLKSKIKYKTSRSLHIACNSMIANHQLMKTLKPQIIVAADPVFHFGCSQYAGEFRHKLITAMDRYKSWFVTVGDARINLITKNLPEKYAAKCIALQPNDDTHDIIYNFDDTLSVTVTSNILTLLMLPLAAFFCDNINIVGCEGRPFKRNLIYWEYDKDSQLNSDMETVRHIHPGFFRIDFNEYYLIHCNTVRRWIEKLETDGKSVNVLTDTYIPALQDRLVIKGQSQCDNLDIKKAIRRRKLIPGWSRFHTEPLVRIKSPKNNRPRIIDLFKIYRSIMKN